MPLTINFKTNQGIITSRQFELNQGVSIYGSFTGIVGEPELFSTVQIQINDVNGNTIFFNNTSTNSLGHYNFYFVTPENTDAIICNNNCFLYCNRSRSINNSDRA